jgi:hypothetical protein
MKPTALLITAAAAITCVATASFWPAALPAQQKEPNAARSKWEYKQVENPTAADLTRIGDEGWEIVTVLGGQPYVKDSKTFGPGPGGPLPVGPAAVLQSTTGNTIEYGKLIYVLKRPR